MRALRWMVVAVVAFSLNAPFSAEDKPKPRAPNSVEKRAIEKERKEKLKEREKRAKDNAKQHEELAAKVRAALEPRDKNGMSGCVLVAKDGKVIFKQGYGFADKEAKRKNTPETIYDACAAARAFTTVAILKLEMEGKLSLDDKLSKFFKFAPAASGAITLTQLLSHTSGITINEALLGSVNYNDRDVVVNALLRAPLNGEPGKAAVETKHNFVLAAAVVEVASGQKFDDYIRKAVLEPAGMKESETCLSTKLDAKCCAVRYFHGERGREVAPFPVNWSLRGDGCIATTVEDLWRFNEAIDWSDMLDKTAREKWFAEVIKWQALTFAVNPTATLGRCYSAACSSLGAVGHFARYPEKDMLVVILLNDIREDEILAHIAIDIEMALAGA